MDYENANAEVLDATASVQVVQDAVLDIDSLQRSLLLEDVEKLLHLVEELRERLS